MYIYIYIYIHTYRYSYVYICITCVIIYIYIYRERERWIIIYKRDIRRQLSRGQKIARQKSAPQKIIVDFGGTFQWILGGFVPTAFHFFRGTLQWIAVTSSDAFSVDVHICEFWYAIVCPDCPFPFRPCFVLPFRRFGTTLLLFRLPFCVLPFQPTCRLENDVFRFRGRR